MSCSLCISQFQLRPVPNPPGGGAFANFALPGGRGFANPRAIPDLLTRSGFLSEYNYPEDFTGKESRLAHLSGQEKIGDGCKGMFLILCMHFFIACQARIYREIGSYRRESTFFGYSIKFLLTLFEKHPFIFIKLFTTYNFTALY